MQNIKIEKLPIKKGEQVLFKPLNALKNIFFKFAKNQEGVVMFNKQSEIFDYYRSQV